MKVLKIGLFIGVILLMALSCGPKATQPTTTELTPVPPILRQTLTSQEGWQQEWENLKAVARKEGVVTMYTTAGVEVRRALTAIVKDKLGLELEFVSGRGPELSQKLFTERRAGLFLGDVYIAGATTQINDLKPRGVLDPIKPLLISPEVTDVNKWYQGKHWYVDKEKEYIFCMTLYPQLMITINTTMVKPDEIKAFRDLLDPKWKGKIVMGDPTKAGTPQRFFSVTMETEGYGLDFLRKLAAHGPTILKDDRLAVEWVARGKNPIGIGLKEDILADLEKAGAPVADVDVKERPISTSGAGIISYINQAAHPNAAKLFINWLLSKEGQTIYSHGRLKQSAREDVPTDFLVPADIRKPGLVYWHSDNEEFLLRYPEHQAAAQEIFGPLLK